MPLTSDSIRMSLRLAVAYLGLTTTSVAAPAGTLPAELDPLVRNRDTTTSPGADFFQYASGKWLKDNPIPPAERGWGLGNLVRDANYLQMREICESAARSNAARGTREQQVGDFWAAGMDSVAIAKQGAAPLKPYLAQIAAIRTRTELLEIVGSFQALGLPPLYSLYVGQDERNSEKYIIKLVQGGIQLPDRDYYVSKDSSTTHTRNKYRRHVAAMFRLLGETPAVARASRAAVMRIETALALRSRTLEELNDPYANYHKLSLAELGALTPALDWRTQLAKMGFGAVDSVVVGQPEFFAQADSLIRTVPLAGWKAYLRWILIDGLANRLSVPFEREAFHFDGTIMSGTPVMRPRWKRVMDAEEAAIGELMGKVWVSKYCPPATKERYTKLTADIIGAYRERIAALPWMSEATKTRALAKLNKIERKVAYPDHWRDYSALTLDRGSYAANQLRANAWSFAHEASKLGKPIDRTEWDMTPQTWNAYYDGSKLEIVLPAAAFMLPGLPDSLVDDAILYSYAGASTIGHEITHGFDDEGRMSDEFGNLNPWWTERDSVQFSARAKLLAEQFDQYVVVGKHVRGLATLGENIADLGGVVLGYQAFRQTEQFKQGEKINGLTPEQRYFLGYALAWLGARRPESLARQIMSDVHAPEKLRVNGPLANIPEFYRAFGIKPGDPMWRADDVRVSIW